MNELTIKERILKTLLESPKTTGKIAIELGYIDDKKHGRYNIIKPDLNTLEQYGIIHRIKLNKKSVGAPATTYDIVYDISNLRKILEKYPSLVLDLQKSDKILSMLVNNYKPINNNNTDFEFEFVKNSADPIKLKDLLRSSPSFFENFLVNDSFLEKYHIICKEVSPLSALFNDLDKNTLDLKQHPLTKTHFEGLFTFFEEFLSALHSYGDLYSTIMMAFEHCVINDYLKGVSTHEALNILTQFKKELDKKGSD